MSCPIGVNTGFIGISGPISQTDIDKITVDSHPLTLALGPKRTTPQIFDNRIDESGNNTCIYDGNTYTLE